MKKSTLYWVAGTGIGVMAVIAVLIASQPRPEPPPAALTAAASAVGGPDTSRNLWCGLAFGIVVATTPAENARRDVVEQYAEGGRRLLESAKSVYLANGFTEETFSAHVQAASVDIERAVNATDEHPPFSFEECSALIGL